MARRGVATGTNMFARSIGSAVGAAVLGAVANRVVAARGGASEPVAIQAGTVAVFVGVAVSALLMLATCAFIPPVRVDVSADEAVPERQTVPPDEG